MPKFQFDEEVLREYSEVPQEIDMSKFTREPNGQLSQYEAASCVLDVAQFEPASQIALQELRGLGVTEILVRYDGGDDEGFAHFEEASTLVETWTAEQVAAKLGEEAVQTLAYEFSSQLLGRGFGTGEYSLEGRFIADLMANTLTDLPPAEA